ncbi:MAG: AAA family ATPase, partial [Cyclobacteriaceae bacterium]
AGRFAVTIEDLKHLVLPVLRHRILLNFKAEAEGITSEHIALHLTDQMIGSNHKKI